MTLLAHHLIISTTHILISVLTIWHSTILGTEAVTPLMKKCGAKYSYCRYKKLPLISNVNQLNKLIYSTVKNKTAHIEFTTTYNADLKEAISRTGQQLSYSYKNIDRVNYTLYSVTFTY